MEEGAEACLAAAAAAAEEAEDAEDRQLRVWVLERFTGMAQGIAEAS